MLFLLVPGGFSDQKKLEQFKFKLEKIIGILKPTVEITISSLQEKLEKNNT